LRFNAFVLDEHGQGQGVDDGGKHAHLVSVHTVEALSDALQATEDVAAAVDDGDLESRLRGGCDFFGVCGQAGGLQTLSGRAAETLSAEFEKYPLYISVRIRFETKVLKYYETCKKDAIFAYYSDLTKLR
jgi:hypothetical protein